MPMMAAAIPILPGKMDQWRRFMAELNGARANDFQASRRRMNVHERTFLQSTPDADMVIVTLDGPDPESAFRSFGRGNDDFTRWFVQQVKEIHGIDLSQALNMPTPELIADSDRKLQMKAA